MKWFLLLSCMSVQAFEVHMDWHPEDDLSQGYHVMEKVSAEGSRLITTVTGPAAMFNLPPGNHLVFVIAFNSGGSSPPSETIPITVEEKILEGSNNLGQWEEMERFEELAADRRFYRVRTKK